MLHILRRPPLVALFTLLSVSLLTGGCASENKLGFLNDIGSLLDDSDDPDLQLVAVEAKTGLDQELAALSQTGQWGEQASEQPAATEHKSIIYDFPVTMNKQVEMYLNLFQNQQRKHFHNWLSRSSKYLPLMQEELTKAGLPLDLAYLSMIESGYNQRAYSKAQAVGLWQFMRATGRQYHLTIDSYVDERRDAEKSTRAAIAFLSDLYKEFGDWHLAVAAYNAGPGKIRSGLRRYKVDNFWDLARKRHLGLETKRYVPKLIAAIIIAKEPEKYGFTNVPYQQPLAYETINVGPGLNLDAVAVISGTNAKEIKELNQELRKGKTPLNRSQYAVKIPSGTKLMASKNLERLHSVVSTGYKTHRISQGETLSAICRRYKINTTTLLKVNNLRSNQLVAGNTLRIPYSTIHYQLLPEDGSQSLAAYKDSLVLHRITPGETISKIAKKYRVPQELIVAWNGLQSVHRIRAGQQLALYIMDDNKQPATNIPGKTAVAVRQTTPPSVVPVLADKTKLQPTDDAPQLFHWYQVQDGDSLWTISRKFNISTTEIRRWNNLKSNLIHPGHRLKVKNV